VAVATKTLHSATGRPLTAMSITASVSKRLVHTKAATPPSSHTFARLWPKMNVRNRQIAVITLLVVLVVAITTLVNIADRTRLIIDRTAQEADQVSNQIVYAVGQQLNHELVVDNPDPYAVIASEHSGVRGLMESTVVTSRPIVYLYIANVSGHIITDTKTGSELATNRHMIGSVPTERPNLADLAKENSYVQLFNILFIAPTYEVRKYLDSEGQFRGWLHIGVSAGVVRRELVSPILMNLLIGLLAIIGAAIVAISSANLLLKPLEVISTSIDRLGKDSITPDISSAQLPPDEMVTGVATRLRQLGERMAGERSELELMRGRLRQVISHLEERLLLINREGRVILGSPDAEQILGLNGVELTGLALDESLGADHPLVALVERAFTQRSSVARTTIHVPEGARTRQVLATIQYIEDAGEPVGGLVSLRDYESYQRLESQWDLSKKLADLGRITSGIAHEVKNPLNAMVIHLEILRSKLESTNGNPTPHIEILDSEIKRLDRVVATFLNFTRPVEVHLQPVNVNAILSQVVALASTEAEERGVSISQRLSPGRLMVKGDADLLTQALLNVIINGCQSMPEGGPLSVATFRDGDGSARIRIVDRGVGIAPEARERIFNLYYTTKKGGTGIGLAQAFRALQLHNGEIHFDSEVGVGTTFEISLPALT
jgi:PAS domain S-box-containing protein